MNNSDKLNRSTEEYLNLYQHSQLVAKSAEAVKAKPYFILNRHKYTLAKIGIFLFPAITIILSSAGLSKFLSGHSLNIILAWMLAVSIPAFIEFAQYATIRPLIEKITKNKVTEIKDYLDVIGFTLLSIALAIFGSFTIINGFNKVETNGFNKSLSIKTDSITSASKQDQKALTSNINKKEAYYQEQIEKINKFKDVRYRGVLSVQENSLLLNYQVALDSLKVYSQKESAKIENGLISQLSQLNNQNKTIVDQSSGDTSTSLIISVALCIILNLLAIYANKSEYTFHYKSIVELEQLTQIKDGARQNVMLNDVVGLGETRMIYSLVQGDLDQVKMIPLNEKQGTITGTAKKTNNVKERIPITGFGSTPIIHQNSEDKTDKTDNESNRYNASVITANTDTDKTDNETVNGTVKYCEYCGNPYTYTRNDKRFCNDKCRMAWHKKNDGFDLSKHKRKIIGG